ncbi:hypothetical protein ABZP36_016885 [Zizania latifolia]
MVLHGPPRCGRAGGAASHPWRKSPAIGGMRGPLPFSLFLLRLGFYLSARVILIAAAGGRGALPLLLLAALHNGLDARHNLTSPLTRGGGTALGMGWGQGSAGAGLWKGI